MLPIALTLIGWHVLLYSFFGDYGGRNEEAEKRMLEREVAAKEARIKADRKARIVDLKRRSKRGDIGATIELADLTGNFTPLKVLAERGNTTAAFALYEMLSRRTETSVSAWRWLCEMANKGYGKAQAEVGYWHRSSVWQYSGDDRLKNLPNINVKQDNRTAYMWYTLASINGDPEASSEREYVIRDMLASEVIEAEKMVRDWKSGDCPSAEHRLPPPLER